MPEYMPEVKVCWRRSPIGARKPSTRTVDRNARAAALSALCDSTPLMVGASRPISRDTVGWEQPNSSATSAWDRLCRR